MRTLYLNCFAGISGDMMVGALLDLGVDFEELRRQLATLDLAGYELEVERVQRSGFAATKFTVLVEEAGQPHRHLSHIVALINNSQLGEGAKARALKIFEKLAAAEAKVHGATVERVHFHEVGAVDSILDICGAAIGLELLGVEKIIASPLRVGYGSIKVAHGLLPIPAPGTAELLRGLPIYAGDLEGEFVTPTGAAIVAALAEEFCEMPAMRMERIGYGAGTRDPQNFPNVLRAVLGVEMEYHLPRDFKSFFDKSDTEPRDYISTNAHVVWTGEGEPPEEFRRYLPQPPQRRLIESAQKQKIFVVETNIDDMNPQVHGFIVEEALHRHALDAFITPVIMKKSRPGALLTILCREADLDVMMELLLTETTTLGIRYYEAKRRVLARSIESVMTPYENAPIRIKVARADNRVVHFQPEYDDCVEIAREYGAPLLEVQAAASAAYREKLKRENDEHQTKEAESRTTNSLS